MKYLIFLTALAGLYIYFHKPEWVEVIFPVPNQVSENVVPKALTKCVTASGKVIYGDPSPGETCQTRQTVEGNLTILPVEHPVKTLEKQTRETDAVPEMTASKSSNKFVCDGRIHCSEMTSREEAVFFIENCPDTKMDGDHDGVPCENDSRF